MALTGVSVLCAYALADTVDKQTASRQAIIGEVQWSEEPSSGAVSSKAAPEPSPRKAIFRIYAVNDSWVAVGKAPDASVSPRYFVVSGTYYDVYVEPLSKFMWIAA